MGNERIHRATSDDGTEIAGRVHGQGPPLVLVPGAMSDGEFVWRPLLPLLTDHFECFAMSPRCRGLSGTASDVRPERLVEDVTAFVDSIGEPVALMGWSQGGYVALGTAENTAAISAAAVYEPAVTSVMSEPVAAAFFDTLATMGELVGGAKPAEAARHFMSQLANDDEMDDAGALDFFSRWGENASAFLLEMQQSPESGAPSATVAAELAKITVPLLVMHGTRSVPLEWWVDGARHVAEHVQDPHLCAIEGGGHFAPMSQPADVAGELIRFFAAAPEPYP